MNMITWLRFSVSASKAVCHIIPSIKPPVSLPSLKKLGPLKDPFELGKCKPSLAERLSHRLLNNHQEDKGSPLGPSHSLTLSKVHSCQHPSTVGRPPKCTRGHQHYHHAQRDSRSSCPDLHVNGVRYGNEN